MSNTFIRNARLKLKKYEATDKQHPEGELLLFENYLLSPPQYHLKIIGHIKKNVQKQVRLF